jgi:hypothetical protein
MLVFLIPPIFNFIAVDLISLPHNIAELTYVATAILLPWPGAIGYRRFYQGILIRNNMTKLVAFGTIIRLISMSATAIIFYAFFNVDGVVVGASALSIGVVMEALASRIVSWGIVKRINKDCKPQNKLSYREIISFYYPLALTSLLGLGVHPLVTFFIGQSRMAIESLAVLPVINSLVFIFRSVGLSYQEVGIALVGESGEGFSSLKKFALILAAVSSGLLIVVSTTPLAKVWLHDVSGLSMELTNFSILPLIIISIMPALSVIISFQRSMLVAFKNTSPITPATAIEVIGILVILYIMISVFDLSGAVAAMIAFILGRLGAILYFYFPFKKLQNQL